MTQRSMLLSLPPCPLSVLTPAVYFILGPSSVAPRLVFFHPVPLLRFDPVQEPALRAAQRDLLPPAPPSSDLYAAAEVGGVSGGGGVVVVRVVVVEPLGEPLSWGQCLPACIASHSPLLSACLPALPARPPAHAASH